MTWYVVEGMDGSGKSTVADIMTSELESEGRRVLVMTHPNRGRFAGRIDLALLKKEGGAARMMSVAFYMIDILQSLFSMRFGRARSFDDVVFVRYSMAATYLPDGLYRTAFRITSAVLPTPDVGILVDSDPGTAMERIGDRGDDIEVYETEENLTVVRERMLSVVDGWHIIGNDGSRESLRDDVRAVLLRSGYL